METTETTERRPGLDWTGNVVGRCPHCAALGRVCAEHSDRERVEQCLMACTGLDPAVVPEIVAALRAFASPAVWGTEDTGGNGRRWICKYYADDPLGRARALLARLEGQEGA